MIAAPGESTGRASVTLALAAAYARQGLRVQTFKAGADFHEPVLLARASKRPCYNLDVWLAPQPHLLEVFRRAKADADLALIDGDCGLFDGYALRGSHGSNAELARWLDASILLVVSARGMSRSFAAVVRGLVQFEPGLRFAGVIAEHVEDDKHRAVLQSALLEARLPPLLGAWLNAGPPPLPAEAATLLNAEALAAWAAAGQKYLKLSKIFPLSASAEVPAPIVAIPDEHMCRIGLASDEAFSYYYSANLDALAACGVQWIPFSPLTDSHLPENLDGLYLGGGNCETHSEQLAANFSMLAAIREFAAGGRMIYVEGSGMVFLGRSIVTLDGRQHKMAGILPLDTAELEEIKMIGRVELQWSEGSPMGPTGGCLRGFEFRRFDLLAEDGLRDGWRRAYSVHRRRIGRVFEGFARNRILASNVHLYWAHSEETMTSFLAQSKPSDSNP
jgi:cobyrinic acid a,c-diamide synthase